MVMDFSGVDARIKKERELEKLLQEIKRNPEAYTITKKKTPAAKKPVV